MDNSKEVIQVPIELIVPNRFQPRINFDEKALQELSDSIKQHGIIQPLVVRKLNDKYEIIAGERRYKAASMAGLTNVPVVINNMSDSESAEVALIENVQRKDLTPIEEALSYRSIIEKSGITQEQLAKKLGLSQSAVSNKLRLLSLSLEVQEALLKEKISERHARSLLALDSEEKQNAWLARILNERLSVRQLDDLLKGRIDSGDDVPLVNMDANIEEIKTNATDIISPFEFNQSLKENYDTDDKIIKELEAEPVRMGSTPSFSFHNIFDDLDNTKKTAEIKEQSKAPDFKETNNLFANLEPTLPTNQIESLDNGSTSNNEDIDNLEMLDFDISSSADFLKNDTLQEESDPPKYLDKIHDIREFIRSLSDDKINIEELDLDGTYKINITIKKED